MYDVLAMSANGKRLKVYARGIRQPWQLAFAKGDSRPFVTDFGQECIGKNPVSPAESVMGLPRSAAAGPGRPSL